jgi:hypothetical protein
VPPGHIRCNPRPSLGHLRPVGCGDPVSAWGEGGKGKLRSGAPPTHNPAPPPTPTSGAPSSWPPTSWRRKTRADPTRSSARATLACSQSSPSS